MSPLEFPPQGEGEQIEAVVKWFNLSKGFGFVAPVDQSADAFIHISVLTRAGLNQIAEGTKLLVEIAQGPKGRQVLSIVNVMGQVEIPNNRPEPTGPREEMLGTVKWFKADKGYGFVAPDDGGKDVFVHKSVVSSLGLSTLETGQRLKMEIHTANKGREALSIEITQQEAPADLAPQPSDQEEAEPAVMNEQVETVPAS